MKALQQHKVDWAQIDRFLQSAEKKLASAQKILAFDGNLVRGGVLYFSRGELACTAACLMV